MGYACPVCSDPQADAGHLANHLAFTAMLGNADHEAWLEEHAPEWNEMGERELSAIVSESVEETEFPQLFEDTVGGLDADENVNDPLSERSGALFEEGTHGHGHDHTHDRDHTRDHESAIDTSGPMDEETKAVLEEAKELTRQMLDDEDEGDGEDSA